MPQRHETRTDRIAIVGMGCTLPGACGPDAYWALLQEGRSAIGRVPETRWDSEALWAPDQAAPGKMLSREGGFVDGADLFDPEFFGLSVREAKSMDPRQRLLMKVAWWALEDAGIPGFSLKGRAVGVFIGASNGEFDGGLTDLAAISAQTGAGVANSVIANRLSYVLGLTGPSMVI